MRVIKHLAKLNKLMTPILLAAALVCQPALAHQGPDRDQGLRGLIKKLELTSEQKNSVRTFIHQQRADGEHHKGENRDDNQPLKQLIQADRFDPTAVRDALSRRFEVSSQHQWQRALAKNEIWDVLTDEQRQTWQDLKSDTDRNKKARRDPKFRGLQLTAQQKDAIRQVKAEIHSVREDFHTSRQALKQQEFDLIISNSLTQVQWQQLYAQYQSQMLAFAVKQAESRHQVWNILTPEQQLKAERRMQRRHSKGNNQRHRRG